KAFVLSLVVTILALVPAVALSTGIGTWAALVFAFCGPALVVVGLRCRRGERLQFLGTAAALPRGSAGEQVLAWVTFLGSIVGAFLAYRWGEEHIFSIGDEKLIHLGFVRLYRDTLLNLHDLGLIHGSPPLNIVHLWEFLLAGWSRIVGVDPLPLFF